MKHVHGGRFFHRNFSLVALAAALFLSFVGSPAEAGLCVVGQVKEVGTWINPDTATTGITRAVFGEDCRDASTTTCRNGVCTTTSAVKLVYTAQLWGKCHPTDCVWQKVDGVYTPAKWLMFNLDQGFAKRVIWGQVWSGGINWLQLIIDTNFVDPARTDYQWGAWMQRQ